MITTSMQCTKEEIQITLDITLNNDIKIGSVVIKSKYHEKVMLEILDAIYVLCNKDVKREFFETILPDYGDGVY